MKNRYIGLGIFLLTLICCLMPALLLYFLGYVATNDWNQDAVQTTCTILRNYVVDDRCSYSCNCRKNSNGASTCQTCYYTCYNGLIDVDYVSNNDTILSTIEVYHHVSDRAKVQNDLHANYPISKSVTCYYDPAEPTFVLLDYKNGAVFLAFFIIFCILGSVIFIGLVGWSLKSCLCFHTIVTMGSVSANHGTEMTWTDTNNPTSGVETITVVTA